MSIIKQTYFDQHGTVAGNAAKTAQWYKCPNCAKQSPLTLEWVGLTKNEVETLSYLAEGNTWIAVELAEAKLKEKNT